MSLLKLTLKMILAFTAVIAIAVSAVALAVGRLAESEFRSYNALYSNRAQRTEVALMDYYTRYNSWDGVQDQLAVLTPGSRGFGQGQQAGPPADASWSYRVADASGRIVADYSGDAAGSLSNTEKRSALPLQSDGVLVGYLTFKDETPLDGPAEVYLNGLRNAVWFGIGIAFIAALLAAGLLAQGITAPVRKLTNAAEGIAAGALDSRAPVSGKDEIAQLAQTFNIMAASLQKADQARQAQTADIAHELRNPLAVLQGSLEALADGIYTPTPDNIEPALDQVRTLNRLVEDLRTLAMVDSGELQLTPQNINLSAFLPRVADAHRESFEGRGIRFDYAIPAVDLPVEADYDRLTQVINNILGNALRYVPEGGTVYLSAGEDSGGVIVSVVDNGPGVPPSDLSRLFERFWRGDPSRSRETGGSGLGLTIARRIIQAQKGRIWAESTPGGGLTLKFWLPKA